MSIKVGEVLTRAVVVDVDLDKGWENVKLTEVRRVKVVAVETCFVCVEEIDLPAHPEYGHPRKWVSRGAFLGDLALTGEWRERP